MLDTKYTFIALKHFTIQFEHSPAHSHPSQPIHCRHHRTDEGHSIIVSSVMWCLHCIIFLNNYLSYGTGIWFSFFGVFIALTTLTSFWAQLGSPIKYPDPFWLPQNYPYDAFNIFIGKYMAYAVSSTGHQFSAFTGSQFRDMVEPSHSDTHCVLCTDNHLS